MRILGVPVSEALPPPPPVVDAVMDHLVKYHQNTVFHLYPQLQTTTKRSAAHKSTIAAYCLRARSWPARTCARVICARIIAQQHVCCLPAWYFVLLCASAHVGRSAGQFVCLFVACVVFVLLCVLRSSVHGSSLGSALHGTSCYFVQTACQDGSTLVLLW